jgi:hypothetical protein
MINVGGERSIIADLNDKFKKDCNTIRNSVNTGAIYQTNTNCILNLAAFAHYIQVAGVSEYTPLSLADPLAHEERNKGCVTCVLLVCRNNCTREKKNICPNCSKTSLEKSEFNVKAVKLFHGFHQYLLETFPEENFEAHKLIVSNISKSKTSSSFNVYRDNRDNDPIKVKLATIHKMKSRTVMENIGNVKAIYQSKISVEDDQLNSEFYRYTDVTKVASTFSINYADVLVCMYDRNLCPVSTNLNDVDTRMRDINNRNNNLQLTVKSLKHEKDALYALCKTYELSKTNETHTNDVTDEVIQGKYLLHK